MNELFVHDCKNCTPLGQHDGHDLYHCLQGGDMPTLIARYGNHGEQYTSGLAFADRDPCLAEAKRRAVAAGLPVTP